MQALKNAVQEDMPRPPTDTVQVTFRIPSSMAIEADEIADLLSKPGLRASRQDAFRAAMARGFEVIRAEAASTTRRQTIPSDRKSAPAKKR